MPTPVAITPVTFSDILGTTQFLGLYAVITVGIVIFLVSVMYRRLRR